jgi:hypothetical protein
MLRIALEACFYTGFAVINGLFRPVGHFVLRNSLSLRQTASR